MAMDEKTKNKKPAVEKLAEDSWIARQWRPMMAIVYMVVIIFDFILFPIGWSIIQSLFVTGVISLQWNPITLIGGGIFHAAMGAVLGVAAYTRGREKIARIESPYYDNNYNSHNGRGYSGRDNYGGDNYRHDDYDYNDSEDNFFKDAYREDNRYGR